jgi:hypothetical protein
MSPRDDPFVAGDRILWVLLEAAAEDMEALMDEDSEGESLGPYTQEEMVYLTDPESDDEVEEIEREGTWANPIDLTCDEDLDMEE